LLDNAGCASGGRARVIIQYYNLKTAIPGFTAAALLQGIRGKLLQLHALRLVSAANSTLARLRHNDYVVNIACVF